MAENFDLIFGQNASQQYAWSDNDYQNGWETVGNIPPTAAQFDALQNRNDKKAQELNNNLAPLVAQNTANNRQPLTAYALKDIRYSSLLPTGWFLECAVDGTTASGEITVPSPLVENATITDGTVTWKVRKIGSGGGEAIGIIKAFAGNGDIPSGYLLCDGAAYSRTAFPDLFACIGTDYGSGDGSTTFNVPDSNQAKRFLQGDVTAGQTKAAGLPNITGGTTKAFLQDSYGTQPTAHNGAIENAYHSVVQGATGTTYGSMYIKIDASMSNPIYGNSDTVQPPALTTRYIIKAFDGQTADSALIDITQYEQELAHKAEINQSNMVHHRDVITTSGTYTAPATGLYKITIKGGGGGGGGSMSDTTIQGGGGGGGEGGTSIGYERMTAGDTASIVIGAGGSGGAANANGTDGGTTAATLNGNTYTATGGSKGTSTGIAGKGGNGTIHGNSGTPGIRFYPGSYAQLTSVGGSGGGAGGASGTLSPSTGSYGGGGAGGYHYQTNTAGSSGGDGFAIFEYYTPGA